MRDTIRSNEDLDIVANAWLVDMKKAAKTIFLDYGRVDDLDIDPRRIVLAQHELDRSLNGPKPRKLLYLP